MKTHAVYQVSILSALMQGIMGGVMTAQELLSHGDFGLGTFEGLGGELIILDGEAYRCTADGCVSPAAPSDQISFAQITFFDAFSPLHMTEKISSFEQLKQFLRQWTAEDPNIIYVVKGHTEDADVTVRSMEQQKRPYPTLEEAAHSQKEHRGSHVSGTLIGFIFPQFMDGVNISSWHMHFLSDDRTQGGHLLSLKSEPIHLQMYPIYEHTLRLPEGTSFARLRCGKDHPDALKKIEG